MGFGKKGKNSFTVHRSEEVLPGDITRELRTGGGLGVSLGGAGGAAGGSGGAGGGGLSRGSSSEVDAIEQFFGDGAGGKGAHFLLQTIFSLYSLLLYSKLLLYYAMLSVFFFFGLLSFCDFLFKF